MFPKEINGWRIGSRIGGGGQASVFEAIKGEGQPKHAIKLIRSQGIKKRKRFVQEINKHLELSKRGASNIIPILDQNLEEFSNGSEYGYIVMPKALSTLEQQIRTFINRVELSLEVFQGILAGVKEAHKIGVIHRDIKPSNILFIDPYLRTPLVSDLGICYAKETRKEERITQVDETVGAKFFMAPEQEQGGIVDVTEAADVYALGKLLHYMLTGRKLFREEISQAFEEDELSRDHRLNLLLEKIFQKSIVREISERFGNIDTFIEAITTIGFSKSVLAKKNILSKTDIKLEETKDTSEGKIYQDDIFTLYTQYTRLLAEGKPNLVKILFDENKLRFKEFWESLRKPIEKSPHEARKASKDLIENQPQPISLTLAIARLDAIELFEEHKSLLEYILISSEAHDGYENINSIPNTLAGFLYILACSSALHFRSWRFLKKLINAEYEWYYQSRKPNYSLGANHLCFFHSRAFDGMAPELHDFYRSLLMAPVYEQILGLSSEAILELSLQTQLLLSLRAAKEIINGNDIKFWADFGRYGSYRLTSFLERITRNYDYCSGISSVFNETPEVWKQNFNPRIHLLRTQRFGGPFGWQSVTEYDFESE